MTSSLSDNTLGGKNSFVNTETSTHSNQLSSDATQTTFTKTTFSFETDTLGGSTATFSTLNFTVDGNPIIYQGNAQNPRLPTPNLNNLPLSNPQPLNVEQQTVVIQFYNQNVHTSVKAYMQEADPPLTPEEMTAFITFLTTDEAPDNILNVIQRIKKNAESITRQQFGLPSNWTSNSVDPQEWTPIDISNVPSTSGRSILFAALNNIEKTLGDLEQAGKKILENFDPDNQNTVALAEFLQTISKAIQDLKRQLQDIQLQDIDAKKNANRAKFSMLEDRKDQAEQARQKQQEAQEQASKSKRVGLAMKIVGPIVGALATIAGVAITVCTVGIGAPAGIALITVGITLGVALTAYSIADSVTDCTSKLVAGFNDWISDMMPEPPYSEKDRKILKFAIVAVVAAYLSAIIIASFVTGSGTGVAAQAGLKAGQITSQVVAQVIQKAVIEGSKQLAFQLLMMTVMGTNALPELVVTIMKGPPQLGDERAQQIAAIVVMVLQMAIIMLAMAKGGGANISGSIKEAATSTAQGVKDAVNKAADILKAAIARGIKASAELAARDIYESISNLGASVISYVKSLRSVTPELIEGTEEIVKSAKMKNLERFLQFFVPIAKASPEVASAIGAAIQGSILLRVSKLLREQGDIKATEELLRQLIQLLEKMIAAIQTGITDISEFIVELTQFFNSIHQARSGVVNQMFRNIQG